MTRRNILSCLYVACVLVASFSCQDTEEHAPLSKGDLFGAIMMFDEFGNQLPNREGVEVVVEGSDPLLQTITDANGKFLIQDLPMGTYNISFEKAGFQSRVVYSYPFVGGSVPTYFSQSVYLSQLSSTVITNFSIEVTEDGNPDPSRYTMLKVEHLTDPPSTSDKPRRVTAYISATSNVSVDAYEYQLNLSTGGSDLIRIDKLPEGTTWYGIAYPEPAYCNPYYNPFEEKYVYSCLGSPADVISFDVP